jgi:hypothetical protein
MCVAEMLRRRGFEGRDSASSAWSSSFMAHSGFTSHLLVALFLLLFPRVLTSFVVDFRYD